MVTDFVNERRGRKLLEEVRGMHHSEIFLISTS